MFFWEKKKKENVLEYGNLILGEDATVGGEGRRSSVVDYLPEGILVFDEQGRVAFINARAENFMDVERDKIIGKPVLRLSSYKNFRPFLSFLSQGATGTTGATTKIVQLRENFILEIKAIPIMARDIKAGTVMVLRDITREKLVETMKNEFVMIAAHQLRTPTSGIKWSLKMLIDGDLGSVNDKQRELIEKAYDTNEKVIKLINDLLSVARIEEGRFLSNFALASPEDLVSAVAEEYKMLINKKGLSFEFNRPKTSLPQIMVDIDKIKIALSNLIDNAVRYTRNGGKVSVSVSKEDYVGGGEVVKFEVRDNGVGIPQDQQAKMFTKFFRSDNVIKIETEGTGLGMFITREIVMAHGGELWFESELGKGTVFYFTIPVKKRFGEFMGGGFY
jgi:two-component system, OmpR family, sensor histidine kinase VicK